MDIEELLCVGGGGTRGEGILSYIAFLAWVVELKILYLKYRIKMKWLWELLVVKIVKMSIVFLGRSRRYWFCIKKRR